MQPMGSGGGVNRGLARFRSAPATWLEALLESSSDVEVEEEGSILDLDPPPKPTTIPTQSFTLPSTAAANKSYVDPGLFSSPGSSAFLRQNSSPAEFLAQISSWSDEYFSNFGIPANYDFLPSGKRPREVDSAYPSVKFSPHLAGEKSGELYGLLDAEMKKLLEDSVPCRIRAKRGCATHPRSIAERVRRTRISDRMRKLQELVPNMDKQTNTADMLDEAVEYVKLLQKQIQELTDHEKKCVCAARN